MSDDLFMIPIDFPDEKRRHVVVIPRDFYDGGMKEFLDPVSKEVVGCCGIRFWEAHAQPIKREENRND